LGIVCREKSGRKGKAGRSFQTYWYVRYPWLEYSISRDSAYCFPCRLFASGSSYAFVRGTREDAYTTKGFNAWKNALDKKKGFLKHEESLGHRGAVEAYTTFLKENQFLSR